MKIYVLGSTAFVKEMVAWTDKLIAAGYNAWIHPEYREYVSVKDHPHLKGIEHGEHAQIKIQHDYIRQHYNGIVESDAIFIVNLEKKGVGGYIGGNVLMELGFAYINHKKIFLLNPIPDLPYREEIEAVLPIVLDGDLSKIK
ncbi:MAG: hypothetical protein WCT02_01575 [Candidatus Paceibacterota bacterium]